MDTLRVEVYLPAQGKAYEVRLPKGLNTLAAAQLTAKALAPLSGGAYLDSHNSVLAWRDSGLVLDMRMSLEQANVENGSKLLLI